MTGAKLFPRSVLRLCSVFEPPASARPQVHDQAGFDPIGGMQNHTANVTRALDRRGIRQTVITSRLGGPQSDSPFGDHARILRVGLHTRRLRQLWAATAYRRLASLGPFDVVHAHQGEDLAALPLGIAAARRFHCPLVVTVHCSVRLTVPATGLRLTVMRLIGGPLENACLRRADRIITLTDATAEQLGDLRGRTVTIPSGVEPELFGSAHDLAPSPLLRGIPRPIVMYLGRLARQKDVPTLVRAFGRLEEPASLVIIGDGPDRPRVDAAVGDLREAARSQVHRFGFRPHQEVPALLAAADVLVLPSIYEEMGSILAEALQAGVPVVASRVGGIPTVVADGTTGLLVPPEDPDALAAAISRLITDPGLRDDMARHSRQRAKRYDWNVLAEAVLETYQVAPAAARR
jgi:glycogen synthase